MNDNDNDSPAAAAGRWLLGGKNPVNRMGFGAMRLPARGRTGPAVERDVALDVLRRTRELGIDHIDTAAFYRFGDTGANELIHSALHPYDGGLVLATKVGPVFGSTGFSHQADAAELPAAVEQNLRELGVDALDLVYLRIGGMAVGTEPIDERFEVLAGLRERGLIRHLGLSNIGPEHLEQARRIAPVVAVQNRYNVLFSADVAVRDACIAADIAFVPFFPLGGNELVDSAALRRVADRHGATVAQIALAWSLDGPPSTLAIPGTSSPEHLAENVAAGAIRLTDTDRADLTAAQ